MVIIKKRWSRVQCKTFGIGPFVIKKEVEYLWQGDPEYWSGQALFCFQSGSVRNGQVQYHLKMVKTGRHQDTVSFAEEFELKNKQTIVLSLESPPNEESLQIIIFELKSFMNYKGEGEITITYRVQNLESLIRSCLISLEGIRRVPF